MDAAHRIAMSLVGGVMAALFLFIVFGDNGLRDLRMKTEARDDLAAKNRVLTESNFGIYRRIQRLADAEDRVYIETIARRELGLIKAEEIVYEMIPSNRRTHHRDAREF